MDRQVTSPTWGPPPPCKQTLRNWGAASVRTPKGNNIFTLLTQLITLYTVYIRPKTLICFYLKLFSIKWKSALTQNNLLLGIFPECVSYVIHGMCVGCEVHAKLCQFITILNKTKYITQSKHYISPKIYIYNISLILLTVLMGSVTRGQKQSTVKLCTAMFITSDNN